MPDYDCDTAWGVRTHLVRAGVVYQPARSRSSTTHSSYVRSCDQMSKSTSNIRCKIQAQMLTSACVLCTHCETVTDRWTDNRNISPAHMSCDPSKLWKSHLECTHTTPGHLLDKHRQQIKLYLIK